MAADTAADFELTDAGQGKTVRPLGDWVVLSLGDAPVRLAQVMHGERARIEIVGLGRVDTAGAFALRVVNQDDVCVV